MGKRKILMFVVFGSIIFLPLYALAFGTRLYFGGKVISSEVTKIALLEKSGFSCPRPPGNVVKIRYTNGQVEDVYLLAGTSRTMENTVRNFVSILGKKNVAPLAVQCTNGVVVIDATLPQAEFFGNSRK